LPLPLRDDEFCAGLAVAPGRLDFARAPLLERERALPLPARRVPELRDDELFDAARPRVVALRVLFDSLVADMSTSLVGWPAVLDGREPMLSRA
jgi:hypothetical protein